MATAEQYKQIFDAINLGFKNLSAYNIEDLLREQDLGKQLSFKFAENTIKKTLELFKRVQNCELKDIPFNILNNLSANIANANNVLLQIKAFNPSVGNPAATRTQLVDNLERQYEGFFGACQPILLSNLLYSDDLLNEKSKIEQTIQSFQEEKNKIFADSKENEKQIKSLLEKARQATSQVGVVSHAGVFLNEASNFKRLANIWFGATIVLLCGIIAVCVIFLNILPDNSKGTEYLVQYTVSRVVILTVLFYGIGICNRNYKAYKHNQFINKHRHNALNTFETFTKAAGDDMQTKNAVLLEATHTIFSNQQTGYLPSDNDSDNPNKIIEIVKNITSKPQSGN